jgi:hypothetical protein
MSTSKTRLFVVATGTLLLATACMIDPNSPALKGRLQSALQMVSAGHTGCLPDDNQISNTSMNLDGSGTWNATCKEKVYLCSAFQDINKSESYSCAPVAQ